MSKLNPEIVEILEPAIGKLAEHLWGPKEHSLTAFQSVDPYIVNLLYNAAEEIYELGWEDGHRHNWEE